MLVLLARLLVVPVSLAASTPAAPLMTVPARVEATVPAQLKRDSMTVTISPARRIEVKLVMKKGERATFEWATNGAEVGFNLHGEVPTDPSVKAHVYERGSSKGEKGSIVAAFDGVHGWSWRNTGEQPVTVTVKASGQFSAIKKM